MEKLGIEKLSPVVGFVGESIGALTNLDANQDGTISFLEIINKVQVIGFKAFGTLRGTNLKEVKAQALDVDLTELDALIETFSNNFDLSKDVIEWLIEDWLRHVADTASLIDRTISLVKKK